MSCRTISPYRFFFLSSKLGKIFYRKSVSDIEINGLFSNFKPSIHCPHLFTVAITSRLNQHTATNITLSTAQKMFHLFFVIFFERGPASLLHESDLRLSMFQPPCVGPCAFARARSHTLTGLLFVIIWLNTEKRWLVVFQTTTVFSIYYNHVGTMIIMHNVWFLRSFVKWKVLATKWTMLTTCN
jgi:hypothetical protein